MRLKLSIISATTWFNAPSFFKGEKNYKCSITAFALALPPAFAGRKCLLIGFILFDLVSHFFWQKFLLFLLHLCTFFLFILFLIYMLTAILIIWPLNLTFHLKTHIQSLLFCLFIFTGCCTKMCKVMEQQGQTRLNLKPQSCLKPGIKLSCWINLFTF